MTTWQDAKSERRFAATEGFDAKWVEARVAKIVESCHPRQREFVEDTHRRITGLCGRRAGKTTGVRARLVIRMLRTPRARCLYIALTRESAKLLLWHDLKDLCERLGIAAEFNETALRCTFMRNGSTLELGGCDSNAEVDKFRGRKFHEVAIDESASFPAKRLDFLINRVIAPTLGDYKGTLVLVGTPGHILSGIFYDGTRRGSEEHRPYADRDAPEYATWGLKWSSHAWALIDGAPFIEALANAWEEAHANKEANRWSDDHPVWMREWLGLWAADSTENVFKYRPHVDGQPWNQWDPERVGPLKIAKLPERGDWAYVLSMDLGASDLFALTAWAFSPSDPDRFIYQIYEFSDKGMYARRIAELLLGPERSHEKLAGVIGAIGEWPLGMVADLAGLGDNLIKELREVYGIPCAGADKGFKYKFPAIELCNGDLVDGRIKILKGSLLEREVMQLQWVADEYGRLSENRAQSNHASDSFIYARQVIARLFESGAVVAAPSPEDQHYRTQHSDNEAWGKGSVFGDRGGGYRDPQGL